jgi:hypothetical protein
MTSKANRRTVLGAVLAAGAVGATTLPVSAAPELSAAEDPIFEAIAKHKALYAAYLEEPTDDTSDAEALAVEAMLKNGPLTLAGARALVRHLDRVVDPDCLPEEPRELVKCLARWPLFAEVADLVLAEEEART